MINEKEFVNHYTFYWNKTFPFSSRLVRKLNLQKEYFIHPLISKNETDSRSIVNEIAFRLFAKAVNETRGIGSFVETDIKPIVNNTIRYIAQLSRNSNYSICFISNSEVLEALELAKRTLTYLGNEVEVSPKFKGCSIINNCYGDVKSSTCIYEVKAGDRDFRVNDIRQLLVYSLLNYAATNTTQNIGLINPRRGCAIEISLNEAIEMASGRGMNEVFNDILEFIDTSEVL